jgi:outer membrane biosynthesis protein TonB
VTWAKIEPASAVRKAVLAKRARSWSVVAEFDLDGTGVPQSPKILEFEPAPDLNELVLTAIRNSRFKAGIVATRCVYQYQIASIQRIM